GSLFVSLLGGDAKSMGGVFAWDFEGKIIALNGDGLGDGILFENSARSWRKTTAPLFGDFDGDAKLDMLVASIQDRSYGGIAAFKQRSSVYLWNLQTAIRSDVPNWPMFGFDLANNN